MIVVWDKEKKPVFFDVKRQKIVAKCELTSDRGFFVIHDTLFFGNWKDFFGISLPFSPEARTGDFLFYSAIDSVL